jgi:hypothetical protein
MGGSSFSDDHYTARVATRAASHTPTFKHDSDVRSGKVATALHPKLDVKGVKTRESRDSDAHPNSRAVAVLLDVTGSMAEVPRIIQGKLPTLMGLLLRKAYLADPQILIGGIGDANSDRVPLQIGQFESGIEIDDDVTNLYLEGAGGGQDSETYELALYFMARHTSMDCLEKRGEKGFLFIIGDERFYPAVKRGQVLDHIGDTLEADVPTATVFAELAEKFEVFFIMPKMTHHYGEAKILKPWQEALGERVLMLEDASGICELIASTIALTEGNDLSDVANDLRDVGTAAVTTNAVEKSLAMYSKTTGGKSTAMSLASSGAPSGLATV